MANQAAFLSCQIEFAKLRGTKPSYACTFLLDPETQILTESLCYMTRVQRVTPGSEVTDPHGAVLPGGVEEPNSVV